MCQHTPVLLWLLCLCIVTPKATAQNILELHATYNRNENVVLQASYDHFQSFKSRLSANSAVEINAGNTTFTATLDQQFNHSVPLFHWINRALELNGSVDFQLYHGLTSDNENLIIVSRENEMIITLEQSGHILNLYGRLVNDRKIHFTKKITHPQQQQHRCEYEEPQMSAPEIIHSRSSPCVHVGLAIVIDSQYYAMHGGSSESQTFAIAHTMIGMYANETDVRIELEAIIGFTDGDPYTCNSVLEGRVDPNELLVKFRDWSSTITYDISALLTGYSLGGTIVGKAYVGTSCDSIRNVCIIESKDFDLTFNSSILAHEIGHLFGLRHDTGADADCPQSGYIMNQQISREIPGTSFSKCSHADLGIFYKSSLSSCLSQSDCDDQQLFVLPIELVSFEAKPDHHIIEVEWETGAEEYASHFELEYSIDGEIFNRIGRVEAVGIANHYAYDFVGRDPVIYLRLKMVDADGSYTYSNVVVVKLPVQGVVVFPNPVSAGQRVQVMSDGPLGELVLYNAIGREVWRANIQETSAQIPALIPGVYFLKDRKVSRRLVVE